MEMIDPVKIFEMVIRRKVDVNINSGTYGGTKQKPDDLDEMDLT